MCFESYQKTWTIAIFLQQAVSIQETYKKMDISEKKQSDGKHWQTGTKRGGSWKFKDISFELNQVPNKKVLISETLQQRAEASTDWNCITNLGLNYTYCQLSLSGKNMFIAVTGTDLYRIFKKFSELLPASRNPKYVPRNKQTTFGKQASKTARGYRDGNSTREKT